MRGKYTPLVSVLVTLALAFIAGCQSGKVAPTALPNSEESEELVSATGKVLPTRWANLGFSASGLVREVLVTEGQRVVAGQALTQLDLPEVEAAVAEAEAALALAQAQLARVEAGPRPVDLRAAEVAVELGREGVRAAEAAVKVSQANVAVAQAAYDVAQASLKRVAAGPTPDELEVARQNVELAKAQRYAAQGQRDAIGGLRGRAQGGDPVARASYQEGAYEAAMGQVLASETSVTIAELRQRILAAGARKEDIAAAQAQVKQARAAVDTAKAQEEAAVQQVAITRRQVEQAEAQLALLKAPPREEDLATARSQVARAEAALKGAIAARDKAWLRAPFEGTVSEVSLRAGEFAMAGAPVMALGDLSALRVETTDLDEIDASRIAEGRECTLAFDALPGVRLRGRVQQLALKAGAGSGGTVFRAVIVFEEGEPRLRWGMTAFADIKTE
jgi:HlyD family secretion protein